MQRQIFTRVPQGLALTHMAGGEWRTYIYICTVGMRKKCNSIGGRASCRFEDSSIEGMEGTSWRGRRKPYKSAIWEMDDEWGMPWVSFTGMHVPRTRARVASVPVCVCRRNHRCSFLAPPVPVCYLPGKYWPCFLGEYYSPAIFLHVCFKFFFFFCFLPCSLLFRTFGWVAVQRAKCCQMFAAFPVVYGALSLQSFGLLTFSTCQ